MKLDFQILFDDLSTEIYYGFNFKLCLSELKKNDVNAYNSIKKFVEYCKERRIDKDG